MHCWKRKLRNNMNISIQQLLYHANVKWGNRDYIFEKIDGTYVPRTFNNAINDIYALSSSLINLGLQDKNILIYGENSYYWAISDLAIMGFVGINVAVNNQWQVNDIKNVLNFVNVDAIIYSNTNNPQVVSEIKTEYPSITYLSIQEDIPRLIINGYKTINAIMHLKRDTSKPCKIVFSSGTTSTPKAAMISQDNMFFGASGLNDRLNIGSDDRALIFLPLNFTYAGILNLLYSFIFGWQVYLCSNTKELLEDLKNINPTIFCAVPLIYEKIYNGIDKKTLNILNKLIGISNILLKIHIDLRKVLFKKIHHIFGTNQGYLICAGAPFNRVIKKFYNDVGFTLIEGYGLTETSSILSCAYPDDNLSSVGTIFDGIDVKIVDPDSDGYGEIIVKGDNVFLGYINNENANSNSFDDEGYFHTGDIGFIDINNHLFLKGRKKRVIITNNGHNVFPDEIEELFLGKKDINKVKVYQSDNKIIATLYVTTIDTNFDDLVNKINQSLPKYKRISSYDVVLDSIDKRLK